ncbi:MAG: hypothetical protein OEM52_13535 [bacterium]|nr:hypothetical protein [bacterium]
MNCFRIALLLMVGLLGVAVHASVFSGQGVGLRTYQANAVVAGRAGLGAAAFDTLTPNILQPAQFAEQSDTRAFISGFFDVRSVEDKLGNIGNQGEFRFSGFGVSTPLWKNFRFGVAANPYSVAKTRAFSNELLGTESYRLKREVTGGITDYGAIVAMKTGKWRFGVESGLRSGSLNYSWQASFATSYYGPGWYTINQQHAGWYNRVGVIFAPAGLRYSLTATAPMSVTVHQDIRDSLRSDAKNSSKFTRDFPTEVRFGLASKWKGWQIGGDYHWANWKSIDNGKLGELNDEMGVGIWCERPGKNGVLDPFFQKITWRSGLSWRKLPLVDDVSETNISLGMGLPIKTLANRCDIAVGYTLRGDKSENYGLEERVVWTSLSITISEKWFEREIPKRRKR